MTDSPLPKWVDNACKWIAFAIVWTLFGGAAFAAMSVVYFAWTGGSDFPDGWGILFVGGSLFNAVTASVEQTRARRAFIDAHGKKEAIDALDE